MVTKWTTAKQKSQPCHITKSPKQDLLSKSEENLHCNNMCRMCNYDLSSILSYSVTQSP